MGTHYNHLSKAVLIRTHNVSFHREMRNSQIRLQLCILSIPLLFFLLFFFTSYIAFKREVIVFNGVLVYTISSQPYWQYYPLKVQADHKLELIYSIQNISATCYKLCFLYNNVLLRLVSIKTVTARLTGYLHV